MNARRTLTGATRGGELLLACALVLAVLTHLPSLWNEFTFDDHAVVVRNSAVTRGDVAAILGSPYWPERPETGLYRPWTTLSFALDWRVANGAAWPFHLGNLLLHAAVVGLVFSTARTLARRTGAGGDIAAGLAALLFAVHPIHTDAVLSVVGRGELWAAFGALLAFRLALAFDTLPRGRTLLASSCAFLLALFSKESAAGAWLVPVALAALAPMWNLQSRGRWLSIAAGWTAAFLAAFVARRIALGAWIGLDAVSLMDNSLAHVGAIERIGSALGFLGLYAWRFTAPITLSADHSYPQLVPSTAWTLAGIAWLAAATTAVFAARKHPFVCVCLIWTAATGLVTSNLLLPIGTVFAERLAYLPSVGPLWLIGAWCARLASRSVSPVAAVIIVIVSASAARTWVRCADWRDDLTLFGATAQASPRSAKAHSNLAVARLHVGDRIGALDAARRSLELAPGYAPAEAAIGSALFQQGDPSGALPFLRRAAAVDPRRTPEPLLELGNAYLALGRVASADSAFQRLHAVHPQDRRVWIGLASAAALGSRWSESARAWQNAVALDGSEVAARRAWAYALWQSGQAHRADSLYAALLAEGPTDAETRNDYAWFLARSGRDAERAIGLAASAFAARPSVQTGDTYIEALRASGRGADASRWLEGQTQLSAGLRDSLARRIAGESTR